MEDEGRGREEGNDMRRNILYAYMKMSYITVYNDSMSIKNSVSLEWNTWMTLLPRWKAIHNTKSYLLPHKHIGDLSVRTEL